MNKLSARNAHCVVAFVDVVDSVGLYRRVGDEAAQLRIEEALAFASACAIEGGGRCVKRNGDELLLLFPNADATCHALKAIQIDTVLELRIGAHSGALIHKRGDLYGDTVNIAARLTAIARAREIVISETVHQALGHPIRKACRRFEQVRLRGTARSMAIYHLCWEPGTATHFNSSVRRTTGATRRRLTLQTKAGPIALGREQEITIGRDPQCDVVINDPRVSRFHATLEWHRGIVVLRDHSTNGSFVRSDDQSRPHFVRREVLPIRGVGELNFGADGTDCRVQYCFE
ncbi:MAG TPA: adenylate/guanylate cyclase domain-containing protein [Pseudomonadales bacterium]|jgi:adenylate cyclase|nr:adenylate/guanylate cyclase domain-containing protein [Pseudomonadales bacterium]